MTEQMNPYNDSPIATRPQTQALVEVESQRSIAEVQSAIILAKKVDCNQQVRNSRIRWRSFIHIIDKENP